MGICHTREDAPKVTPRQKDFLNAYEAIVKGYAKLEPAMLPSKPEMEKALRPTIEGFFKLHDSEGCGVLDKDESKIFFHTLVANSSPFNNAKYHSAVMKHLSASEKQEKAAFRKARKLAVEYANDQHRQAYEKNKDEYDNAAFKVLDTSGDGKLRLQVVLQALLPHTDLNNSFYEALGVYDIKDVSELNEVLLKQYKIELEKSVCLGTAMSSQFTESFRGASKHSFDVEAPRPDADELHERLKPIILGVFALYDTSGNGSFEPEEANVWFESLVNNKSHSHWQAAVEQTQWLRALEETNALLKSQEHSLSREIKQQHQQHSENKEECMRAAFQVLDKNGDHKLEQDEVMQALLPGTRLSDDFLEALGYPRIDVDDL